MKKKLHYKCLNCNTRVDGDFSLCNRCKNIDAFVDKKTHYCTKCRKSFIPSKLYQLTCSDDCEKEQQDNFVIKDKELFHGTCINCKKKFRKTRVREKTCYDCIKSRQKSNYKKKNPEQVWLNKKKKKGTPLHILIQKMEYKRVMDDEGWDHYLKGKKYDKI